MANHKMNQADKLVDYYKQLYIEKYESSPVMNRSRDKWKFADMASDLGFDRAKLVIAYYFDMNYHLHPVNTLLAKYDHFFSLMKDREDDELLRKRLRNETKEKVRRMNLD